MFIRTTFRLLQSNDQESEAICLLGVYYGCKPQASTPKKTKSYENLKTKCSVQRLDLRNTTKTN